MFVDNIIIYLQLIGTNFRYTTVCISIYLNLLYKPQLNKNLNIIILYFYVAFEMY